MGRFAANACPSSVDRGGPRAEAMPFPSVDDSVLSLCKWLDSHELQIQWLVHDSEGWKCSLQFRDTRAPAGESHGCPTASTALENAADDYERGFPELQASFESEGR